MRGRLRAGMFPSYRDMRGMARNAARDIPLLDEFVTENPNPVPYKRSWEETRN